MFNYLLQASAISYTASPLYQLGDDHITLRWIYSPNSISQDYGLESKFTCIDSGSSDAIVCSQATYHDIAHPRTMKNLSEWREEGILIICECRVSIDGDIVSLALISLE